jgi:hypothetical protein
MTRRRTRIVTSLLAGIVAWFPVGVAVLALFGDTGFPVCPDAGIAAAVGFWAEAGD